MIEEIKDGSESGWKAAKDTDVRIYEGGNFPSVRKVSSNDLYKTDIEVRQNDGVVIVFQAE
jgi:hypothetical protein